MPIYQLDTRTAKLIGSSLVVTSVYSTVKELLENSIDAGATSINIFLEKYGLNRIEVRDNGSGICHADIPLACLAGHTSKIQGFSDLDNLHSYGFRGQALNALCAVSDLSFTTRTSDDDVATTYSVDKEGRIASSAVSHLGIGTSVIVKNLFVNLPVRRKLLSKSPSCLRTILWLMRCFSLAKPNLALSLVHDGSLVWRKCTAHALPSAVQEALGYKLAVMLHQIYWKGSYLNSDLSEEEVCEDVEIEMDILVPKKGPSMSEFCSSQTVEGIVVNEYLIINGRPVKHKRMEKVMIACIGKGLGSEFPNRKKPPWVLRLKIPSHQVDVNLESDKTKVLLRCEDFILHVLEERILTYYGIQLLNTDPSSQSTLGKSPKNKLEAQKPSDEPQSTVSSNSPHQIGMSSDDINDLISESDPSLSCHPPPSKQARIEREKVDARNSFEDLDLDNINPIENSQPFLSLAPFEVSDSQISEIEPIEDLESNEHILDVGPLKLCTEKLSLGSFKIEVLKKSEGTTDERVNIGSGCSTVNENSGFDSSKSPEEVSEVSKNIDERSRMVNEDIEVANLELESLNSLKDSLNEDELDLEAWSTGKVIANGLPIEEPVKILQSKPTTSENASAPRLITNKQVSTASFKMLNKSDKDSTSSKHSSESDENTPITGVGSPLPNACSQLGRRDMRGFDCFAAKTRPKIIAEQPGILFTNVASELARRWEALSDEERNEFKKEGITKAASRHKSTNPETTTTESAMESLLPKKTAQKLPMILSEKDKQENLLEKVVKKQEETLAMPNFGRTMNVSIYEIRKKFKKRDELTSKEQHKKAADDRVLLIGQLKPSGMWIYKQGKDIGILRHFALQELVVHQKLMDRVSLPILPLTVPIVFDERVIGSELWRKFLSLESQYDPIKQQTMVTSELIVKNGFQISFLPGDGEGGPSALITGIASVISPYGVDDLKDILHIIDSADGKLSKCRTLQISSYIESEATRMCRQSSPVMPRHDVLALLAQWNGRPKCLHSQPVLVPFENISLPSYAN